MTSLASMKMNITEAMQTLYCSHQDCGIESYQGSGFTVWIVDEHNRRIERQFEWEQLDAAGDWLLSEASQRLSASQGVESSNARSILAELSEAQRKDPRRIESRSRGAAARQDKRMS